MSALLARIMLVIFMLPSAAILYVVGYVTLDEARSKLRLYSFDRNNAWWITGVVIGGYIAAYWLLIWRRSVRWSGPRIVMTWIVTALSLLTGGVAWAGTVWIDDKFAIFVATTVTPIVWLILTTLAWKETAAERTARLALSSNDALACPTCGYNLTGLKGTRCPECGNEFTLNELLASTRDSGTELNA